MLPCLYVLESVQGPYKRFPKSQLPYEEPVSQGMQIGGREVSLQVHGSCRRARGVWLVVSGHATWLSLGAQRTSVRFWV